MKMEIWSGLSSDGMFRIHITDDASNTRFLELKITPENFAFMLSNRPVECDGEVVNTDKVGKVHHREPRSVVYTGKDTSKPTIRKWLLETQQEEGWIINSYLGSQSSVVYDSKTGHYTVNYAVEKWV